MEQEKKYAVKIINRFGKDKYVKWCNDNWYEATNNSLAIFTKKEAEKIVAQMKNHYQYILDLVSEDGKVIHYNCLWKARHTMPKDNTPPKRKSIFKIALGSKPTVKPQ